MVLEEASDTPGSVAMHGLFQLGHWVSLPAPFDRLKFRRALTAMSVGPVDHDWLSTQTGLTVNEASALLQQLYEQDALIVLNTENTAVVARSCNSSVLGAFWRWLWHGV